MRKSMIAPHVQPLSQEKPMSEQSLPTGVTPLTTYGSRWYHLISGPFAVRRRCTGSALPSAPRNLNRAKVHGTTESSTSWLRESDLRAVTLSPALLFDSIRELKMPPWIRIVGYASNRCEALLFPRNEYIDIVRKTAVSPDV